MTNERDKLFKELRDSNAGCFEMAWNGFIRIYEEGEEHCRCETCLLGQKFHINQQIPTSLPLNE